MTARRWKWVKGILLLGSFLAAVKMIFFDYTLDEEYQIVMAYRSISGDSLFAEMWEPHQTSAFLCSVLMRLFYAVTGTWTCVIVYLRVCTTLIQIALSVYLYRILCHFTQKRYSYLLALAFFNVVPKNIEIPDFSNMQLWFFTLTVLLLMQYYFCGCGCISDRGSEPGDQAGEHPLSVQPGEKPADKPLQTCLGRPVFLLVTAGICMSLEVLSYPTCVILFPFFLIFMFQKSGVHRWRDCMIFAGTCFVCGMVWLLLVLRNVTLPELIRNVGYLLDFDVTHDLSGATEGKMDSILSNLAAGAGMTALIAVISLGIVWSLRFRSRRYHVRIWSSCETVLKFSVVAVLVSEFVQLFYWVILKQGFELPHIHFVIILIAGGTAWRYVGDKKKTLAVGIIGSLLCVAAVIYISDLPPYNALPQGVVGVIFCTLVLIWALEDKLQDRSQKWIWLLLLSLSLTCLIGKGFTMRGGRDYNTVLSTQNIMRYGPAAGILTD